MLVRELECLDGAHLRWEVLPAHGHAWGRLVLVQEIFGLTPALLATADRYAAAGLEVHLPSLFDRVEPHFMAEVNPAGFAKGLAAVRATPFQTTLSDLQVLIDQLQGPIFLAGFCWGGTAAWMASAHCRNLQAAAAFYGRMINDHLSESPKCPLILHYGESDPSIPPAAVDAVAARAPHLPLHRYPAGHGFCRLGHADYHGPSADLAFARTIAHFSAALESPRA